MTATGKRRWLKWVAGALVVALAAVGIALTVLMRRAEPILRALIVERLQAQFHSKVELDGFHMSIGDGLWAEGKGLRIWAPAQVAQQAAQAGKAEDGPLIAIEEFRFHAPLKYKPGVPIRIAQMELVGVVVDVPARPQAGQNSVAKSAAGKKAAAQNAPKTGTESGETDDEQMQAEQKRASSAPAPGSAGLVQFVVERVDVRDARLTMETSKPGKLPLEFAIDRMYLTNLSASGALDFDAELENPEPRGKVFAKGHFGPWVAEDPGASALDGIYKLENADLGTFKGIGGALNSNGTFKGALRELSVNGEADVPKFTLSDFGTPMPLATKFHARVDGTDGDTWLQPVDATLGRSHFTARGEVVRVRADEAGEPVGHEITLTVNVDRGRIEDFLKLTSRTGEVMLTGDLKTNANMDLKPGTTAVEKRITVKGGFALNDAEFTSAKVQHDIGELSARGEGKLDELKNGGMADVKSAMQGDFSMAAGAVTIANLVYTVPGAEIDMSGRYGVADGSLAFNGRAKTEATVSQMVGGWKGTLLKPADRFFRKDGAGMEIPIHVDGTRENPHFGIDFEKMKKTSPQRPGGQ